MSYNVVLTYDGRERKVGTVVGDTLICHRKVRQHLFRSGRPTVEQARKEGVSAWGLDCKVCDRLLEMGVVFLNIVTDEGEYQCRLEDMRKKGIVLNMKPHRAQYFLNENMFERK
jgi:hypothetical protein